MPKRQFGQQARKDNWSRVWPLVVTWRHRSRDHSTSIRESTSYPWSIVTMRPSGIGQTII